MISPFLFIAATALGPPPCMVTVEPTTSVGPLAAAIAVGSARQVDSKLGEPVTLELSNADLLDVLEKVSELLDVTLIASPGVEGTVTVAANDTPLREILKRLEREQGITIAFEGNRMLVRKSAPRKERSLAESSLPRRPASEKPRWRGPQAVVVRPEKGDAVVVALRRAASAQVPGCASELRVFDFGVEPFEGRAQLVVRAGDGASRKVSRVVSVDAPGSAPTFLGFGPCRLSFAETDGAVPEGAAAEGTLEPGTPREQYMVQIELKEVTQTDEKDLSSPRIQTQEEQSFGVSGGDDVEEGKLRIHQRGIVFSGTGDAVDLVLATTVLVDLKPKEGETPMTVRTASAQEWLKMSLGRKTRVMISPTYGLGKSALVADVTVTRVEPRKSSPR